MHFLGYRHMHQKARLYGIHFSWKLLSKQCVLHYLKLMNNSKVIEFLTFIMIIVCKEIEILNIVLYIKFSLRLYFQTITQIVLITFKDQAVSYQVQ